MMPVPCQLISGNIMLITQLRGALDPIDLVAADTATAASSPAIASAPPDLLLVVDAQVPQQPGFLADTSEESSLAFLRDLRRRSIDRPILVITSHPMGITTLDQYCTPDNHAIALPFRHLQPSTLEAFARMLLDPPVPPNPTWTVIEIEVKRDHVICFLCDRNGKELQWSESSIAFHQVQGLALQYARPDFRSGWARQLHGAGSQLFDDLVMRTLGSGLFAHLERAAGGLQQLAFRFRVDDATLYSAPFEAAVRFSEQPYSGTPDDFAQHPFVLVHAPITRRMKGAVLRMTTPAQGLPRPAKVLFIRSQVGDSPAGPTAADTVEVTEIDPATGAMRIKHVEFRRLDNIDREREDLEALRRRAPDMFSVEEIDLSRGTGNPEANVSAEAALLRKLKGARYDVVHFAGHSLTTKDLLTLLVLPSGRPGEAEAVPIETFATAAADVGARLVYLSSCQGSSANTVANLAQRGVPHVLGFRWDVEDDRAADFAKLFYEALFGSPPATICASFRAACQGVYQPQQIERSPIWASPILATRSSDWAMSGVLEAILERP